MGGERFKRVIALVAAAHEEQQESGDPFMHKEWVELLLCEYYDPMYDYQIKKGQRAIQFRGNSTEVLQYLRKLEMEML